MITLEEKPRQHPTLRHAGLDDIPKIIELSKDLYDLYPYKGIINVDRKKLVQSLEAFIISDNSEYIVLLSYDGDDIVGALIAYAKEPLFSSDKVAFECFWYLKPEYRTSQRGMDMMKAYEYWAKAVGCKMVHYGWLSSSPPGMKKLFQRNGCKFAEETYYKEL